MTTLTSVAASHHPAIRAREPITTIQDPEFLVDFLGIRTRVEFMADMPGVGRPSAQPLVVTPAAPAFDEEYFEWIDVLEAVEQAGEEFVMVELGAGFGRWSMRAAAALSRTPGRRFRCVAVEAEPEHFRWMLRHFTDNGLDPKDLDLTWAAVGAAPGFVPFWVGNPGGWYGQAVAARAPTPFPDIRMRRKLKARSVLGRPPIVPQTGQSIVWVPCTTLKDLVADYPRVDLVDLDIQGLEFEVLAAASDLLDSRVRRIHIGTHSAEVEHGLRALFTGLGWEKRNDYPCQARSETPYGEILFGDGVQTWVNPRLGEPERATRIPAAG